MVLGSSGTCGAEITVAQLEVRFAGSREAMSAPGASAAKHSVADGHHSPTSGSGETRWWVTPIFALLSVSRSPVPVGVPGHCEVKNPEPAAHMVRHRYRSRHESVPSTSPVGVVPVRGQPATVPGAVERTRLPSESDAVQYDADGHETLRRSGAPHADP